jgi:hypothetical protein
MILLTLTQGSPEWLAARAGVITASRAKDACDRLADKPAKVDKKTGEVTPAVRGAPSQKQLAYAALVAMERVAGVPCDDTFVNNAMKRGSALEPEARLAYEARTGHLVQESGLVLTDDGRLGYSTDGFIGSDGAIEIKAPFNALTVVSLWRDVDLSDYMHQMQFGLWITGRKWIDFVLYDPRLAPVGKDLLVRRVERDEAFIEQMSADLEAFCLLVNEYEAVLRRPVEDHQILTSAAPRLEAPGPLQSVVRRPVTAPEIAQAAIASARSSSSFDVDVF